MIVYQSLPVLKKTIRRKLIKKTKNVYNSAPIIAGLKKQSEDS